MITSRQRIKKLLKFEEPDRIGIADSFWEDTLAKWIDEGMPVNDDPGDYFGFDFD